MHTLRPAVLIWAVWSFTLWDTAYIFLRPHTLPDGKWHDPIFLPMDDWASTDHIYGEHAWQEKEGFTAAQGAISMLEATLCMWCFVIAWRWGRGEMEGGLGGKPAARVVLVRSGAGFVTATKTSLYFMREVFSGYEYTGHNEIHPIWTLWGFMNLFYLTASFYVMTIFGKDVLEGLYANSEMIVKK